MTTATHRSNLAAWVVPGLGIAWNSFGIFQFMTTTTASVDQLIAAGMTPPQATLYAGLPGWMILAYAVGVFGGLAGSVLLGLRHRSAIAVLATSLAGYLVLYIGDITQGVFAAFGLQQVVILSMVVIIAVALLLYGLHLRRRSLLA